MEPSLDPEPIRTFVALPLADAAREAAHRTASRLRRELGDDRAVKWEPRENLHVTLHFLGDTATAALPAVEQALAAALARHDAFDLDLGAPAWFPGRGAPRVFVVEVAAGAADLASIHATVGRVLAPLGHPPEGRPFRAHVTLARVRQRQKVAAPRADRACAACRESTSAGHMRASEVVLYRSTLSPEGATYERLAAFPLGGG